MTNPVITLRPFRLEEFEAIASEDPVKTDLELTCLVCDEVICDVESGDTLQVLVATAEDHWSKARHGAVSA